MPTDHFYLKPIETGAAMDIHHTARSLAALHTHIDWTWTETTDTVGDATNRKVVLTSSFSEHAPFVLRQTIWRDGDATPVSLDGRPLTSRALEVSR